MTVDEGGVSLARRPVFIVGSGRSGNTLLRRLMMATGEVYIPPETYVLGDIITSWPRLFLLDWQHKVWLFCAHFERHPHFPTFGLPNLNDFAAEALALGRERRTLRHLFDLFYRHLAGVNGFGAARWGDKTPFNSFCLREIGRTFPDAQFVYLSRNGLDVTASYLKAGLQDSAERSATRWARSTKQCERMLARHPDRMRKLRYEEIVRDPDRTLEPLFEWLSLPYAPDLLERDPGKMGDVEIHGHHARTKMPISAASIGKWRETLDAETLARLPAMFWEQMRKQGYAAGPDDALAA